jgi:hypothetical protein
VNSEQYSQCLRNLSCKVYTWTWLRVCNTPITEEDQRLAYMRELLHQNECYVGPGVCRSMSDDRSGEVRTGVARRRHGVGKCS